VPGGVVKVLDAHVFVGGVGAVGDAKAHPGVDDRDVQGPGKGIYRRAAPGQGDELVGLLVDLFSRAGRELYQGVVGSERAGNI